MIDAARVVLERMATVDEHGVGGSERELIGESIRAVASLPAKLLNQEDKPGWWTELASQLTYACALLTRLVLSLSEEPIPSPAGLVELVESSLAGKANPFVKDDPWAGRVAYVVLLAGEMAHVTHDREADRIGALATLCASLEFLTALPLDASGDAAPGSS